MGSMFVLRPMKKKPNEQEALLRPKKRKQESEAKKMQEKCKDFVEFTKDECHAKSKDSNPVSRALRGRSHYEVLGVPEGSTDEEIRLAFRQLARVVHPDKNQDPRAGEAFAKVQQVTFTLNIPHFPMNHLKNDNL